MQKYISRYRGGWPLLFGFLSSTHWHCNHNLSQYEVYFLFLITKQAEQFPDLTVKVFHITIYFLQRFSIHFHIDLDHHPNGFQPHQTLTAIL